MQRVVRECPPRDRSRSPRTPRRRNRVQSRSFRFRRYRSLRCAGRLAARDRVAGRCGEVTGGSINGGNLGARFAVAPRGIAIAPAPPDGAPARRTRAGAGRRSRAASPPASSRDRKRRRFRCSCRIPPSGRIDARHRRRAAPSPPGSVRRPRNAASRHWLPEPHAQNPVRQIRAAMLICRPPPAPPPAASASAGSMYLCRSARSGCPQGTGSARRSPSAGAGRHRVERKCVRKRCCTRHWPSCADADAFANPAGSPVATDQIAAADLLGRPISRSKRRDHARSGPG